MARYNIKVMLKIKSRKLKIRKKGFFLIEGVIAAFIVTVGLVAVINLIVSGISHTTDSRDHIIASQLAQEGVELVRNIRDNNWANNNNSFDPSKFPIVDRYNCRIDKDNGITCNDGINHKKLYYNNGFYVHTAGTPTPTKFQRKIELKYDTGNANTANSLTVTSIVIWGSNFHVLADCNVSHKCVYAQSVLTKWREEE